MEERADRGRCPGGQADADLRQDPAEAVDEELARFEEALNARKQAESERLEAEKAKLAANE